MPFTPDAEASGYLHDAGSRRLSAPTGRLTVAGGFIPRWRCRGYQQYHFMVGWRVAVTVYLWRVVRFSNHHMSYQCVGCTCAPFFCSRCKVSEKGVGVEKAAVRLKDRLLKSVEVDASSARDLVR